jgi:hypothetical protein
MSPQLVSQLLNDKRERLSPIPKESTVAGIARPSLPVNPL